MTFTGKIKTCKHCGFVNAKPRVQNPVRCPRCGNPYGCAPVRKHYAWWTVVQHVLIIATMIALIPVVTAEEITEVGGMTVNIGEDADYHVCFGQTAEDRVVGRVYACLKQGSEANTPKRELVDYCDEGGVPARGWCMERPIVKDWLSDFFSDVLVRLRVV